MSTPSLNIQAYGTSSSLIPRSIQNSRNNNLEILTVVETIPANTTIESTESTVLSSISHNDLSGKEIIGSTVEFDKDTEGNLLIETSTTADLLANNSYSSGAAHNLEATLSNPVTAGSTIVVKREGSQSSTDVLLTLRLILRKL